MSLVRLIIPTFHSSVSQCTSCRSGGRTESPAWPPSVSVHIWSTGGPGGRPSSAPCSACCTQSCRSHRIQIPAITLLTELTGTAQWCEEQLCRASLYKLQAQLVSRIQTLSASGLPRESGYARLRQQFSSATRP